MINIKELSIGNWVKFPYSIDKIVDLPYIEGKGMCASFAASATLFPISVKDLEPIEITPEILEKNGLEKQEPQGYLMGIYGRNENDKIIYAIYYREEDHFLSIEGYDSFGSFSKTNIRYIHQLQNVLKLCGINKEIEL